MSWESQYIVPQFLLAATTFPRKVPGMAELRGQTAPRMGFLSVKDTWQQTQLVIWERGKVVTSPACSSGWPSVCRLAPGPSPRWETPISIAEGRREVVYGGRGVDWVTVGRYYPLKIWSGDLHVCSAAALWERMCFPPEAFCLFLTSLRELLKSAVAFWNIQMWILIVTLKSCSLISFLSTVNDKILCL